MLDWKRWFSFQILGTRVEEGNPSSLKELSQGREWPRQTYNHPLWEIIICSLAGLPQHVHWPALSTAATVYKSYPGKVHSTEAPWAAEPEGPFSQVANPCGQPAKAGRIQILDLASSQREGIGRASSCTYLVRSIPAPHHKNPTVETSGWRKLAAPPAALLLPLLLSPAGLIDEWVEDIQEECHNGCHGA